MKKVSSPRTEEAQDARWRVLMIAPTSFFGDYGCHVRILEEARILQRMGHQVTIVTYRNGRPIAGLDIRRTLPIPWRHHYEVGSSRHKVAFDALLGITTIRSLIGLRPHVIHAHLHEGALIGYVASRLGRVPMVFDFQGSMTAEMIDHRFLQPGSRLHAPLLRLEGFIDRKADYVITSSRNALNILRRQFHYPEERSEAVPDCVNTDLFRPRAKDGSYYADRASLGLPPDAPVVVYLGLLAEYQGLSHLLKAAALLRPRHPEVRYLIMGYPSVDHYRQQSERIGMADRTIFTGRVPYEQAPRWLGVGDIAVAPKLSATEGCGKILNYMAVGLPTVAFDTPVSREYLGDLGTYASDRTAEALADALARVLDAGDRGAAIGMRLRKRAIREFSWSTAGAAITAVYERLIAGGEQIKHLAKDEALGNLRAR